MRPTYTADDFEHSPFVVFYEVTRACDLVCQHCRACAQPNPHPSELRTSEATRMLNELASFPKPPLLVLTGGDPLKRPDLLTLIAYARQIGLSVALTPSATPLVTPQAIAAVRDAGVGRIAVSLDGQDAATHDALRGVPGSFNLTQQILHDVRDAGLPLQVNTTVAAHNIDQLDAIADLVAEAGVVLWSVFFLVPVGRALTKQRLTAAQCEQAFERLYHHALTQPYAVKATDHALDQRRAD